MATKLLVCLVMIAAASAVPPNRDVESEYESTQCAKRCYAKQRMFNYKTSETYVYEYKAEAETSLTGASEDKARMYIETLANIEVIDKCEFALRLQNVKVFHSEPYTNSLKPAERSQDFQTALMENTLRFSFDDGIIRDICHTRQEKTWVLNFKRGLLSAFQHSTGTRNAKRVKEVDVSGECYTDYVSSRWSRWSGTKVTKSKNLTACYQRSGSRTFMPMVPYKIDSEIQSLPIVNSSYECELTISTSKYLESSICSENHLFAPLSNRQSGAATKVKQTLVFKAVKSGIETSEDYIQSRSNLLFQHLNGVDEVSNSKEAAEQKLKEICEQTKTDIRPETPRLFTELVQIVKVLDSSDLRDLYRKIKSKKLCSQNDISMKFLLDTLPIASTPGAVELMVTVINGNDLPDLEKSVWLTSLSLIPEPSEDMLPSLMKLLNGKSADKALLPVTALLNTMCRKSINCDRSYQFKKIVNKINDKIDSSCTSNDYPQLMETLRAIGNVGYGKTFLRTLKTCLSSTYATLEVKIAAADAYRRFECQNDEETGPLFEVFENEDIDSELRIMSFLSLMRCPRFSMLQKIADQLSKENDIQVATFVYTHLVNLKQTSDPHKKEIVRDVERLTLKKIPDSDFKTSRCFESSTLLNRLNLGYVADGDIIWSQSSVVPRALRLNLTVEMFGNSVNLFEAGVRMDGMEKFIQKYFGLEGYLPQNKASPEDLEAFIYARMFGNELFFKHMKGSQEFEKVKSYLNFDKLLENLSRNYNFGYTHSQQLMDHSFIIPTIIGLPVNLTVNSSVTIDTRAKGKIDFSGILSRSKSIVVSNDIAASAGLEVSGSMMVDAQLYKQGLRMRNTLHSSVSMKSDLTIKGRQIVNFEIDSPQQKQEIFDAKSQFFIIHDNFEEEQDMIKENRKQYDYCTGDKFAKVTGLELCGELQYPNASIVDDAPYFPLTGPVRASLVLNKKDTHRSYKLFAKWMKNSKKLEAQLQMDTPGSQVDRHISADVTIGIHKSPHVDIVLISPWKKFTLNGKAAKNKDMASLTGNVAVDEDIQYKLTSELKMSSKSRFHEYLPFVEIARGNERITLLSGSVVHNEKKNISSKLELRDLNKNPYTLGGHLVYSPQEKRIELSAATERGRPYMFKMGSIFKKSGKKNTNIKVNPELLIQYPKGKIVSLTSNGDFQAKPLKLVGNMELNTIRMRKPIKLKFNVKQKKKTLQIATKLDTPILSGNVNGKVNVAQNSYSSAMKIKYKAGTVSDEINWDGKLQNRSKSIYTHYNLKSNLRFKKTPEYNSRTSFELTHKTNKKGTLDNSTVDLTIYYGKEVDKSKVIQLSTVFNADWKKAQIKADVKTKMPEMNFDMKIGFDHLHSSQKLDSEVKFSLASQLENDIKAMLHVQSKGAKFFVMTADGNLEAGGEKYSVKSGLYQKSQKRYEQSLTVKTGDDDEHSLVSVFKKAKDTYQIQSSLQSSQLEKPLSLELSSDVENPFNFHVSGAVKESNRKLYSVDALSKYEEGVAGKMNVEIACPMRKMMARANFNNVKNKVITKALINWDVESKDTQKPEVDFTGLFVRVSESDSLLMKGNVKVNTPFEHFEKLSTNWNLDKSDTGLKSMGKISWGGIHKQLTSSLTVKLPISFETAKLSFQAKTPFKNYKDFEFEVDHKLNSDIKSTLRGKLEKHVTELKLNGKKNINDYSRSIEGDLTLKTPYRSAREIALSLAHSDDENEVKSTFEINKDGQMYRADLISSLKNEYERKSQIKLSGPERSTETSLTHKIQDGKHQIEASIDSSLNNNKKQYKFDISGHYLSLSDLKLEIDVKSPVKVMKKGRLELGLQLGDGTIENKIIYALNRDKIGYDVKLGKKENEMSADVRLLLSLITERTYNLHWVANAEYENYPVTVRSELSLAPYRTIAILGSYKAPSLDDLEIDLSLASSVEGLKSVAVVASNVLKNSVRVSHLNIDYDVRKMVDIEVRSQNDEDKKLLRLSVKGPNFPFESLDTGLSIDSTRGLFSKADLELLVTPKEKYEGIASLKVSRNENVRGKLDIKTPVDGFKHIEGSLVSDSRKYETTKSLSLSVEDKKIVDVSAKTKERGNKLTVNVAIQGSLLETVLEEYTDYMTHSVVDYVIPSILRYNAEGAKNLSFEIIIEETDGQSQWTATMISGFKFRLLEAVLKFQKSGDNWNNFDVGSSLHFDNRPLFSGKILVKLSDENDKKFDTLLEIHQFETRFELSGGLKLSNIKGKFDVRLPADGYRHIEGSLVSKVRKYDTANSLLLSVEDKKIVDISAETKETGNKLTVNVVTQGSLFESVAEEYADFVKDMDVDSYLPDILRYKGQAAKKLSCEIIMEEKDGQSQWTATISSEFKSRSREAEVKFQRSGNSWTDFGMGGSWRIGSKSLSGKILVKLVDANDIKFESVLTFPSDEFGITFSSSGSLDQLETKGSLKLFFIEGNFNYLMNSIQHIKFTTGLNWIAREKFLRLNYTHEGQDNRASCSLSMEDEEGIRASFDLVGQTSPIHLVSLKVKTPFENYTSLVVSGNYDETKINGLIKVNEDTHLDLSGVHDNLKNPKLTLKTPLRRLQVLSVDINGDLSDGSSSFTLQLNDNDQIEGNVAVKYDSPSQMEIISTMKSKIDESENNLKFEFENTVEPVKTSRLLLLFNDMDKIVYTSRVESYFIGDDKLAVDLSVMFPSLGIQTQGLILKLDGTTEKADGYIELLGENGKILDADVNLDLLSDKKATLTFSQPKNMEYSFTQRSSQKDNEIYFNWDKTDPGANLVIGATYKDDSSTYRLDKAASLRLTCPSGSIGFEHAITATRTSIDSSGRLYWGDGFYDQVSYDLKLKNESNTRTNAYDGELKLTLPVRTLHLTGSASDQNGELKAETMFSWDLDYDSTKKVGIKGTLHKEDHTQADISLILPKDAHVDSKLVMNKGNTILEGQTQIFYSDDSRKTLTLFSKLENNPGESSFFYSPNVKYNYSIQLGMSHPESRIDVKMVSHLGVDSERLTTSVGLDYLNSRRQTKNMDLFMEINELKKEINLISVTPYKSVSLSSAVISQDPVEYKSSMIVDDEERYAAHLKLDPTQKKVDYDWTTYGTTFSYSAFFPNKTTLQVQRKQQIDGPQVQDYQVLFQLSAPDVLRTTLNWRRGLIVEARDRFFDDTESFFRELKGLVDDVGTNLRREVEGKYSAISSSILDDAKSIVNSMENELAIIQDNFLRLELILLRKFDFCTLQLEEYVPLGSLFKEHVHYEPLFDVLRKPLQSLSKSLEELQKIPTEEVFEELMTSIDQFEKKVFTTRFWRFFRGLFSVTQEKFDKFWDKVDEEVEKLDPQRGLDEMNEEMERLRKIKASTLIMNILERYGIVSYLKNLINEHSYTEAIEAAVKDLEDAEVYRLAQQYGLVGTVPELRDSIVKLIIEVIDQEVRKLMDSLRILRNPITRFDPEKGILEVEIPLFISFERLDQIPSLDYFTDKILYYFPKDVYGGNASTSVNEVILDGDLEGFDEYKPSPRFRNKK